MSQIDLGNAVRGAIDGVFGSGSTDSVLRTLGLDGLLSSPSPITRFGTETGTTHQVKRGDTLDSIARAHGTTWQTLARVNGIANPDRIAVGQAIRLPTGTSATHTVRAGETLSGIAARNGTTVAALMRANPGIRDADRISPGQQIRLGGTEGTTRADTVRTQGTTGSTVVAAGSGRLNLGAFLDASQGSRSMAAIVIGNAEGTRTPSGGTTRAYGGHIDPGNAAANRGSFSLQGAGAVSPNRADQIQLGRLAAQRPAYEAAARAAGLDPNNATLATAYFDLYNQSPSASRRFLNQLDSLSPTGITAAAVADLRFHSFVDRTTGRRFEGAGGGFATIARNSLGRAPSEAEVQQVIRADQTRRTNAMHRAMTEQGLIGAATADRPTPRPVNDGAAVAARFPANRGIDLSPATVRNANALYDAIRAETGHAIHVTSGRRGPERQAAAMYDNYADGTPPTYRNRAAEGEVRAAYLEGRRNGWSRARTVETMTAVLSAQVDRGVYLSRHMRDGSIDIRTPPQHVITAIRNDPNVRSVLVENDHIHIDFR